VSSHPAVFFTFVKFFSRPALTALLKVLPSIRCGDFFRFQLLLSAGRFVCCEIFKKVRTELLPAFAYLCNFDRLHEAGIVIKSFVETP